MTHFRISIVLGSILLLIGIDQWTLPIYSQAYAADTISLPSPPVTFQPASGSDIASSYCLICHSAEYVYMQPPHSQKRWDEIVKKMKHAFGCPIPEEYIPTLVGYLVSQNTIQPMPRTMIVQNETFAQNTPKGNPSNGKIIYNSYCTNCHGSQGKGDGPIGQSLVPQAANLTTTGKKSDKELLDIIRKGRPGTAMPSWKGDLSDAEIHDVLSYVRKLAH